LLNYVRELFVDMLFKIIVEREFFLWFPLGICTGLFQKGSNRGGQQDGKRPLVVTLYIGWSICFAGLALVTFVEVVQQDVAQYICAGCHTLY